MIAMNGEYPGIVINNKEITLKEDSFILIENSIVRNNKSINGIIKITNIQE